MEFRKTISQAWKVMENSTVSTRRGTGERQGREGKGEGMGSRRKKGVFRLRFGKVMENDDNVMEFLLLH